MNPETQRPLNWHGFNFLENLLLSALTPSSRCLKRVASAFGSMPLFTNTGSVSCIVLIEAMKTR